MSAAIEDLYQEAHPAMADWPDDEAPALVYWATLDVRSLGYLADLDSEVELFGASRSLDPSVIDNAHPRWAATTAISSVDRCSAALARVTPVALDNRSKREANLRSFDSTLPHGDKNYQQLTEEGRAWVDRAIADSRYRQLLGLRNALVHSRLGRVIRVSVGDADWRNQRGSLKLEGEEVHVRDIIEMSRDFANAHVAEFLRSARRRGFSAGGG